MSGSVADVNAALAAVAFIPAADNDRDTTIATQVRNAAGTGPAGGSILLDVTPVNVPPVLAANAGLSVAEGAAATITSASLRATDVDTPPAQLLFTVRTAPGNGTLRRGGASLGAGGTFTQADLDAGQVSYTHDGSETSGDSFTFTVSDRAGGTIPSTTFVITITGGNDPPTQIALSGATVAENSPNGSVVGTLSTTDPDPGDTHTYTLLDDAAGRFAVVGNQLRVANGSLLNFEAAPSHQMVVRSTDSGNQAIDRLFVIVTLSAASGAPVTVQYATALGTATPGSDFQTASGTLTFAPGETSKPIQVAALGDTDPELDEAFTVTLTSPTNAALARAQATATIRRAADPE